MSLREGAIPAFSRSERGTFSTFVFVFLLATFIGATGARGTPTSVAPTSRSKGPPPTPKASSAPPHRRGQALFTGAEPLQGRIRGHQSPLPSEVVRCVNCHGAAQRALSTQNAGAPTVAAPALDRLLLLELRVRRGGPPSMYDATTFCKLLRTGVDPSYVLIAREMPTYDIDDGRCSALWLYLIDGQVTAPGDRGKP